MLNELNTALQEYDGKWQTLVAARKDKAFFAALKPVAVGWKTEDRVEYDKLVAELHDQADQIVETWMNGRWIAKLHLKDTALANGVTILKIMQRRPGSEDAVGLDHVDFYSSDVVDAEPILKQEPNLNWTRENNDVIEGYDWISVWFDGAEAKLKSNTVLDIVQAELHELNKKIVAS